MSMLLMVKAMQCKIGNPARKLVLLKLADNANDDGVCFPSYQYIADQCEISRRSAINHIDTLVEMGFVSKKERKNKDGSSSNLYQLHLDKPSENSALGGVKNLHHPSENSALGGSEKSAPITSHSFEPVNEPKKTTQKTSALALLEQFGITEQLAIDFIAHRKAKRAAITKTALDGFQREADKAGIPIQQAIAISIERNWQGFNADWYGRCMSNTQGFAKNPSNRPACNSPDPFDNSGNWAKGRMIYVREDAL
ncbi:helix-turn-helix domain-containing protein [Muribacter muris]|uniref:Helix-turn-helix domain-containing protein n=1 Tax=Muribacter muris TaxID=67855 RepID=A0A4Y9JS87_9PAST|nr:helix-turn-helix domain-containing protein [Muribacter muris]MBF0785748.1 helix-turn-helix domain-containing protein [Muribacter muris]MBF0828280.1 helix-turn-helix domain-containing protein [Muribacter muris]TFV08571.1 helix-turn-helix domain-containing protein [Muribacter muris]